MDLVLTHIVQPLDLISWCIDAIFPYQPPSEPSTALTG